MSSSKTETEFAELLTRIDREVQLSPGTSYRSIGVKWYGEGAYVFQEKLGREFQASRFELRKDDVVYNDMWARRGSAAIVPAELDGCVCSAHFPTFEIRCDRVLPAYFRYYFRTPKFWEKCEDLATGSTGRNAVTPKRFLTITIPLPPVPEQQRIVAWLDCLDARVSAARALCSELRKDAAALIASLHLNLAGKRRMKLSEIFELHEIEESVSPTGSYPQVGIRGFGGGLFQKNAVAGTDTTYRSFHRLCPDAIVLSQVKGWEGAIAVAGPALDGWFASPEYRTFRCKPEAALPNYIRALLPTPWFIEKLQGLSRGQGARRQRTRPEQFLALEMPMPTCVQQETALAIFAKIRRAQESLPDEADLAALLPSALAQVFGG